MIPISETERPFTKKALPAAESTVCEGSDVHAEACTHDKTRRFEHLRHPGTACWTEVSKNDNGFLAFLDGATFDSLCEVVFGVEGPCLSSETEAFFTCDFGNGATWCEIAFQDSVQIRRICETG